MNEKTATEHAQDQGRIKRQLIEQMFSVPIHELVSDQSHGFMQQMMDKMTDKLARNMNWHESPIVKIKTEGDRIKLDHIPREKLYLQTTPTRTINPHTFWPLKEDTDEIELTFEDGGFV